MNNIGYAFIGTPKGLQTKNGGAIASADIRRYIDLDSNLIKVDPNTELFAIRKVLIDKDVFYFITQYEYAKEIESQRTGTFFGSTLVLKNTIAPAELILLILSELMASIREYIAPDGKFMTTLDRIPIKHTRRLQGLEHSLNVISTSLDHISDENLFIHLKDKNDFRDRVNFIHQCLTSKTFESFSTVYASDDQGILNFVRGNKTMRTASIGVSYESSLEKMEKHYQKLLMSVDQESKILSKLNLEKEQLLQTVEELAKKQRQLSSKYKATEQSIVLNLGKLEKTEKSLNVSVKSLQKQQQVADQNYQKSVQDYESDQAHFQQDLTQLRTKHEELQTSYAALTQTVEELQQQKLKLQQQNQRLMDDFELIHHNVEQSEQRNQQEFQINQTLLNEQVALENSIRQLKDDFDSMNVLVQTSQKEVLPATQKTGTEMQVETKELVEIEAAV